MSDSKGIPGDVTQLAAASASGSADARDRLIELVYAELLTLARSRMRDERPDHTLSATALVNETFLRLFRLAGVDEPAQLHWMNRATFFKAAATAMRRILVDHARAKATKKRGGEIKRTHRPISVDVLEVAANTDPATIVSLDEAITRLEKVDERAASVVRLRFFAGQELIAIAELLDISDRTVKRDWEFARAWLQQAMDEGA